ncbi:hypothetical protein LDJ79_05750 [Vibrio tritonius]|uniref:Uncharacterized protein n=1 Tax=Vibrio tritonius TaxID=1435069 RepID=A0ABS7YL53_9VIBR|nr:hypothetical protein [Vibrio tritonius]MCA2015606.1 hypothetical protein [Vibrio tritonius]
MTRSEKIKCNNIEYRKGFIEVMTNVHEGFVNIEAWNIHPAYDLSKVDEFGVDFLDDNVTGNVEIEMNVLEVESLIAALNEAVSVMKAENA